LKAYFFNLKNLKFMKRYLLLFACLMAFFTEKAHAQCQIRNLQTKIISSTPNGSQCNVLFDVSFELEVNNGNKTVVLQSWESNNYPGYWGPCDPGKKAPKATNLRKDGIGPLPFINLAFDLTSTIPTKFTSYVPDNTVPLTSSYTISVGANVGGFQLITLKNISVTAPTCSGITMLTDIWSSQSTGWGPSCVNCNNIYAFNYPKLFGIQGCNIGANPSRNYYFTVENSNTNQTITYEYRIYRDSLVPQTDPNFGIFDATDIRIDSGFNRTLLPAQKDSFQYNSYPENAGQFINQKLFIVVNVNGVGNSVVESCAQPSCTGTLPVTLTKFDAKLSNNNVILIWETSNEINNKGFEIQRRLSGANAYENIGFVKANAAEGLGDSYSFTDPASGKGSIAYRLGQVDHDGKKTYSDIRVVNTGSGKSQMIVYPNPSRGSARVSLPVQTGKADISLEDFSGKTIQRWAGYSSNTLQLDQLRPGIYLIRVRVQETGEQMIDRLIVQ
jgi:hypothetical protein